MNDLPLRIEPHIRFDRRSVTVIAIARDDHASVRKAGVDIGAAAAVPGARMVDPLLNELDLQSATSRVTLVLQRRQVHLTDEVMRVTEVGIDLEQDAARPPLVYLLTILLGLLLHFLWPAPFVPRAVGTSAGVVGVFLAVVLFAAAVHTFKRAGTPVPGNQTTTVIVRDGPFRYSRNPIYLAFSLFQLGLALWVSSLWLLLTLIPAVALMSFVVIPREERYLERKFPVEYTTYKASVRRWL